MQKALRLLIALYNWLPIKRVQTNNLMPIGTAKLSIAMACHISTTYQLATTVGTGNLVKTALHANFLAIQLQNTGNSHHLALPFHWVKPKKNIDYRSMYPSPNTLELGESLQQVDNQRNCFPYKERAHNAQTCSHEPQTCYSSCRSWLYRQN